jgi:hypothetical protein
MPNYVIKIPDLASKMAEIFAPPSSFEIFGSTTAVATNFKNYFI